MAKRSKPRPKTGTGGNRKNLTLVALAGFLLVVWGFVLGVLVGRGTVPTIIPDRTAQSERELPKPETDRTETTVSTSRPTTTTTATTRPGPTTTLGFYKDLSEEVAETLPPLPPPTTLRTVARTQGDKPSSASKTKTGPPKKKKEEPKKEPPPKAKPQKAIYSLQVAAFATRKEAEGEARRVASKTEHKVRVVASKVKGKIWHRVRVGGFATRAEAKSAARALKAAGLDTMLVRAAP